MDSYYLEPRYDNRKSFYHKALVRVEDNGTKQLYSYDTLVAEINSCGELHLHDGCYDKPMRMYGCEYEETQDSYFDSQTTRRHINEFVQQNGMNWMSKKDMVKFYEKQEVHD